jgi:hypothetical protein
MGATLPEVNAPPRRSSSHWALLALAPAAWIGLVVLGLWVAPDPRGYGTHEQLGLRGCAAMELLGVPCPGCGVTTSVALAVRGQPVAAAGTQPFGLLVLLLAALYPLWAIAVHRRGEDLASALAELVTTRRALAFAAAMLAAWVYKLFVTL